MQISLPIENYNPRRPEIAKRFDFDPYLIHSAGHINMRMPHYMYIKIATALNSQPKAVNGSKILSLGVAYKPDIDDARE